MYDTSQAAITEFLFTPLLGRNQKMAPVTNYTTKKVNVTSYGVSKLVISSAIV